jgi:hypothetical protein
VKLLIASLFALVMGSAPFQCAADPDPERRMQDSPSEALFELSERFQAEGNEAARRTTLETIVDRYPSSREAAIATDILAGREPAPEAETAGEAGGEGSSQAPASGETRSAEANGAPTSG